MSDLAALETLEQPAARPARRRRPAFVLMALALYGALVVLGPVLAPYDPAAADFFNRLAVPSLAHPMGTDQLGRDVLSRLLTGFAATPLAAAAVVVLALAGGGLAGFAAAMAGGLADRALMRLAEALMTLPALAVALAIAGVLGIGLVTVVASLAVVHAAEYARLVRNLVLAEWAATHVFAARALGVRPVMIAWRHVAPALIRPVGTLAAFSFSWAVLSFAGLSFLGLGTPPGASEWGAMIAEARSHMRAHPNLILAPGLAIVITVLGANLLGDWLGERTARPFALFIPKSRKDIS
ncbi:MAG: ABC transporter permease [Acuticoccus sp.]